MKRASFDDGGQLPHLETFTSAAETGSFTATGKKLGLTQAAVSQRIQVLEHVLNTPLFRRQGGHVGLTEAGRQLYGFAERILSLHREARETLTGMKSPVIGELSLAASSVPGEHMLPGVLSTFSQQWPHIRVCATVTDSRGVLTQVQNGTVELGLVGMKEDTSLLQFEEIAADELVMIVAEKHAWSSKSTVTLHQLSREPLIMREAGSGSRDCLERALSRNGKSLHDLNIVLQLGSNEAVKQAVLQGIGVAILSSRVVHPEIHRGVLHPLRVSGFQMRRSIFTVRDCRRELTIPARLFSSVLKSAG